MALNNRPLLKKFIEEIDSQAACYGVSDWWRIPGAGFLLVVCDNVSDTNLNIAHSAHHLLSSDQLFFEIADMLVALTTNPSPC